MASLSRLRTTSSKGRVRVGIFLAVVVWGGLGGRALAQTGEEAAVSVVLDELHQAAAEADAEAYFKLYARDFIFLGTDATERWDRRQFMAYATSRFARGQGWTYTTRERHVYIGPGAQVAWFDERLHNVRLGDTRGSGTLVKEDGDWKISQYHLTIPVPNALAPEVVARIRTHADARD